jgi:signal transduction histidine kinase
MFKSLQSRLTLSYVVIIVVCLVFVSLAAWVLLRGYQRTLVLNRLTDRSILAARLTSEFLRRTRSPEDAVQRLAQQISRSAASRISVYLLDPTGQVVVGSNDKLDGQQFENLALRQVPPPQWPARGEWRLAAGDRLLYVAEPVQRAADEGQLAPAYVLLLAEPFPVGPVLRTTFGDLMPRLAWAGAVALAVSIILAALMAYSIARPLDRIARAAEEIAAGNYDQQLDIATPTEVARLATSFNSMARQVKATLQSQQDLVANVSHELKTPLTSIQGFSQALLDGAVHDDAARDRAASIIHEESGHMRRLVDDLLELARLESGQVTLAREAVDLTGLLRDCVARFAPQSEQGGVVLDVEEPSSPLVVVGDLDRLGQVFGNLVDNALKHAGNVSGGGRVVLRAEQQPGWVLCSVTDNGRGIPGEDLPRVFERFYQVDKSRARRGTGVGLGLAIAREIIQAHGGRIGVESVEGLGTRFTVELPAGPGEGRG